MQQNKPLQCRAHTGSFEPATTHLAFVLEEKSPEIDQCGDQQSGKHRIKQTKKPNIFCHVQPGCSNTICTHCWDAHPSPALQILRHTSVSLIVPISLYFSGSGISRTTMLRLVGGLNKCIGRVEMFYNNEWGTVCDDSWDMNDAMVVCRQLGCGMALSAPGSARFGWGSGRIWLDEVNCTGEENDISQCKVKTWGVHNCHHGEDAGVVCSGNSSSAELRLVNGPSRCTGRVEVLHDGQWGTVCDDGWDLNDGKVVCRQLGCGVVLSAPGRARFGQGTGHIWLDDVSCVGSEDTLSHCRASPWGRNNCNHREDASVVCSEVDVPETGPVRLVDGPNKCAGRVEVLHENRWGSVCDDHWDMEDAKVVCKQVGCGSPLSALGGARYGRGPDVIWLDDVNCTGTEESIFDCQARPWGQHDCYHGEDADVVCAVNKNLEEPETS
uniref:Soluble scavenger receptor cysteine-rich domain-containing protein SSC5D n=1 Tax=Cairina moschata TaxID=8855 RepID=A0A8C3CFP2_CAIMO